MALIRPQYGNQTTPQYGSNRSTMLMNGGKLISPQNNTTNNAGGNQSAVRPMTNTVKSNLYNSGYQPSAVKSVGHTAAKSNPIDRGTQRGYVASHWTAGTAPQTPTEYQGNVGFSPVEHRPEKFYTVFNPTDTSTIQGDDLLMALSQAQGLEYDPEVTFDGLGYTLVQNPDDDGQYIILDQEGNDVLTLNQRILPGITSLGGRSYFDYEPNDGYRPEYLPTTSDAANLSNRSNALLNLMGLNINDSITYGQGGEPIIDKPGLDTVYEEDYKEPYSYPVPGGEGYDPTDTTNPNYDPSLDPRNNNPVVTDNSLPLTDKYGNLISPDEYNQEEVIPSGTDGGVGTFTTPSGQVIDNPTDMQNWYYQERARIINAPGDAQTRGAEMRELYQYISDWEDATGMVFDGGNPGSRPTGGFSGRQDGTGVMTPFFGMPSGHMTNYTWWSAPRMGN